MLPPKHVTLMLGQSDWNWLSEMEYSWNECVKRTELSFSVSSFAWLGYNFHVGYCPLIFSKNQISLLSFPKVLKVFLSQRECQQMKILFGGKTRLYVAFFSRVHSRLKNSKHVCILLSIRSFYQVSWRFFEKYKTQNSIFSSRCCCYDAIYLFQDLFVSTVWVHRCVEHIYESKVFQIMCMLSTIYTLTRKTINLPYSIRMYWNNFWLQSFK